MQKILSHPLAENPFSSTRTSRPQCSLHSTPFFVMPARWHRPEKSLKTWFTTAGVHEVTSSVVFGFSFDTHRFWSGAVDSLTQSWKSRHGCWYIIAPSHQVVRSQHRSSSDASPCNSPDKLRDLRRKRGKHIQTSDSNYAFFPKARLFAKYTKPQGTTSFS